jgi:DNA-binding NarL/FixJ family response regulator
MLRVLIASASKSTAQSLSASLRNLPDAIVVGVAENAANVQVAIRRMNLEALLLDTNLPEAMQVWTQIRTDQSELRVIVVTDTSHQQEAWRVVGVHATLAKDAPISQLREALFGLMV